MISDVDGSLGSRYFLNVVNERTCFASCACVFKISGLITCLECTSSILLHINHTQPTIPRFAPTKVTLKLGAH